MNITQEGEDKQREEHLEYFKIVGLELKSEDDDTYHCVWKGTDKGLWFRKEGLSDMIAFERGLAKKQIKAEYEFLYGRYGKSKK
jgi:hypothetical protein